MTIIAPPCLRRGGATIGLLLLAQAGILLFPSIAVIGLGLGLFLGTVVFTLVCIVRQNGITGWWRSLLGAVIFLALLQLVLQLSQQYLLFGYKAVDGRMAPTLVSGDHYFADKMLFQFGGVKKGDVYVIRSEKGGVTAARLTALPGEMHGGEKLGPNDYLFRLDNTPDEVHIIGKAQILARPLVIYGTFDPQAEQIVWPRLGQRVE